MNQERRRIGGVGAAGGFEGELVQIVDQHLEHFGLVVGQINDFSTALLGQWVSVDCGSIIQVVIHIASGGVLLDSRARCYRRGVGRWDKGCVLVLLLAFGRLRPLPR